MKTKKEKKEERKKLSTNLQITIEIINIITDVSLKKTNQPV